MKVVVENIINELYGSEIQNLGSDIEIIALSPENHMDPAWDEVSDIDALFLSYQFLFAVRDHRHLFEPMLNLAKKSRFIQSGYSGMDDPFLQSVLKETTAVIANSSSIYGKPMANYVLAQMLRWNKRIDHHIELQKEKDWKPHGGDGELTNKNLLIYGYGGIGKEIARIAKSFEMNITGIRRSPAPCNYSDDVKTPDEFMSLLPLIDFLVMVLPDSEETRDIIDAKVLQKMNPQSMLINVGRGSAVKEEDLAMALNNGDIAAAALDTTKSEPLAKNSPLWNAKNCFISAHDSAHSLMSLPRSFNLFLENLANLRADKPITNLFKA